MMAALRNWRRGPFQAKGLSLMVSLVVALGIPTRANAEANEVRLAYQYGIPYLPLLVMKKDKLIEQEAKKAGLGQLNVEWAQFGSGAAMNTALLAGQIDVVAGGVAPLLKIWDKSKGQFDVKGMASLGSIPMFLNTIDPKVKSIKDFTKKDRIALPAVKVSIQALVLEMASAQAFGKANFAKLDGITVSMKHPDAMAALLSHGTEITAHFANPPFQEMELDGKGVHKVLSSYDVLGPSTLDVVYSVAKFHKESPKIYKAVFAALGRAMQLINADKRAAAGLYVQETHSKLSEDFVYKIISNPEFVFTTTPQGVMKYAEFMHRTGAIESMPASWKNVFFSEVRGQHGS